MKKLSLWRSSGLLSLLCAALLAFAACSNSSDSSSAASATNKTIYVASSKPSDYMNKVVKGLGYKTYVNVGAKADGCVTPDVFVIKGSDLSSLSEDDTLLALLTCLDGKTLVIDEPTPQKIAAFGSKMDSALNLEKNKYVKARAKINENVPDHFMYQLIIALSDEETETNPFTV